MDDRTERAVRSLERLESPMQWQDVERRAAEPEQVNPSSGDTSRSSRRVSWVAAALLVVVAAIAVVVAVVDDSVETVDTGPGPTEPDPANEAGSPVGGFRYDAAEAWTGGEYLVWGGRVSGEPDERDEWLADGWSYDPASGTVTAIPPGPLDGMEHPVAAWDGSELFICCGDPGASTAASYNPATGSWRELEVPHGDVSSMGLGATRSAEDLVVLAGTADGNTPADQSLSLWALNLADNWWRELPAPRPMPAEVDVHQTDEGLLVWGRGWDEDSGQRFDLTTEEWIDLPPLPSPAPWFSSSVWTGEELVVWGISRGNPEDVTVGYRWSPASDDWTALSPAPIEPVIWTEGTPGSQKMGLDPATGWIVAVSVDPGGGAPTHPLLSYQPDTDSWKAIGEVGISETDMRSHNFGRKSLLITDGQVLVPDATDPVAFTLPE